MSHADILCTIWIMDVIGRNQIRTARAHPLVADSLLAAALTALVWLQLALPRFALSGGPPIHRQPPMFLPRFEPTIWAFVLVAICFLPLALRRRYPLSVLAVSTVASAVYSWPPHTPTLTVLAVLIALYTVGTRYPREQLALATVATVAISLPSSLPEFGTSFWVAEIVRVAALLAAAAFLGDATRNRRAYVAEVEHRAIEAERTREEEARRRVDEERLRIARELHDIIAHSLSIIAVQSGMAKHVLEKDPKQAAGAIGAISKTSRSALHELRSVIGVLRGAGEQTEVPLTPAPSLTRLPDLTRPLEEAGLTVDVEITGHLGDLASLVDVSAYRIVQEAFTNIMRHAKASRVEVRVSVGETDLCVNVRDDGTGVPESQARPDEGHGIPGMRERALALGGTFDAVSLDMGGFEVSAHLPLKGAGT